MTTVTCDVCGREIKGNSGRRTLFAFPVPVEGLKSLHFYASLNLTCEFNTTGVDWCDACLAHEVGVAVAAEMKNYLT